MGFIEYLPAFLNNIWLYGILFLVVITFVIFIHEMGHYLAARLVGVRPEIFSLGFGKELIGRTDQFGTRWSLRMYPFGGYVRMFGEAPHPEILAEPPEELKYAFYNKSVAKRAFITVSGPLMNFIFCIALLACVYMTIGRPSPPLIIVALGVHSPAVIAGMRMGDEVIAIDGIDFNAFDPLKAYVADKAGRVMRVKVRRGNDTLYFEVTPADLKEKNFYGFDTKRGSMYAIFPNYGLKIDQVHEVAGVNTRGDIDLARKVILQNSEKDIVIRFGKEIEENYLIHVSEKLNSGLKDKNSKDYDVLVLGKRSSESMKSTGLLQATREAVKLSLDGVNSTLGTIFQIIVGTKKPTEMGGVIKISTMTGEMVGQGLYTFLKFVALLSLSIGLINLLPIPMLDGGHLMFQLMEAIKGGPVSLTTKGYVYGVGLIFLFLTIFLINVNDLVSLFKKL